MVKERCNIDPQKTRFYFWGSYICANYGKNRSRNVTARVPTDGYIDRQTD